MSWGKRNGKYNAYKTTIDGITYDSKFEAARHQELKLLERAKMVSDLRRQVKFELIPKQKGERACCYIADFVYTEDGRKIVEDTKSPAMRTKDYVIKRKLMKQKYPEYEFREVVK